MATEKKTKREPHGMKRNDHYSDRYTRKLLEFSAEQIAHAKFETIDGMEDIRFCRACETFFAAEYFISTIEFGNDCEFVCARCASRFECLDDEGKAWMLGVCDRRYEFYKDEYEMTYAPKPQGSRFSPNESPHQHLDHKVGERPFECTPCFVAIAHYRP